MSKATVMLSFPTLLAHSALSLTGQFATEGAPEPGLTSFVSAGVVKVFLFSEILLPRYVLWLEDCE